MPLKLTLALLVPLELAVVRLAIAALAAAVDVEQRFDLHRQTEQLDKAFGVLLVVDIFLAERGIIFAIQAVTDSCARR